jgi:membrane fusion protein (multidrug efflux system)
MNLIIPGPSFSCRSNIKKPFLSALFFIFLSTCILSCGEKKDTFQKNDSKSGPTTVDVIIAAKESVSDKVEVNGTVVANEFAELRPEVSGLLTYLNVPEGKTIQKGTVIARINSADLVAQMNKSKVLLDMALVTEDRLKKLIAINGVNQADFDLAVNNSNSLRADMAYTQALIDKTIIRAPFTGVVGLRKVSAGSYVSPTSVIATMQQLNNLRIDFTVPEAYQDFVKKGGSVDVVVDQKGTVQKARIIATEPQVDQSTRNITVRAELGSGAPSPGSFAKVYLNAGARKSSIMIPTNCIIPESRDKKVVTVKGGKAVFVSIETGVRQADFVEVIKGINAGDSVVVSGVLFARPDAPVKVRSVKNLRSTLVE